MLAGLNRQDILAQKQRMVRLRIHDLNTQALLFRAQIPLVPNDQQPQLQQALQQLLLDVANSTLEDQAITAQILHADNLTRACRQTIPVGEDAAIAFQRDLAAGRADQQDDPDFHPVDYTAIQKFCRTEFGQPVNYRSLFSRLFTYGETHRHTHAQYKQALAALLTGSAFDEFQIIKNDPLQSIVDHFMATQTSDYAPQVADLALQTDRKSVV